MREIREAAVGRGWRLRIRHWQGNPTAFEISGKSSTGVPWIMTHSQSADSGSPWAGVLALRFPSLAGQTDFAVFPREPAQDGNLTLAASRVIPGIGTAVRSSMAPFAIGLVRNGHEQPVGFAEFDRRYRVLSMLPMPLLDVALASPVVDWPAGATTPHSIVAWRDPFAFRIQARLPGPPSWSTVEHFVSIAEAIAGRLPVGVSGPVAASWFDRLLNLLLNS